MHSYTTEVSPVTVKPMEHSQPHRGTPCKCSKRFTCEKCHRYWVVKRWKKGTAWLDEVRSETTVDLFGMLTVPARAHWTETLGALLNGWATLGKIRSREKRKVQSEHPLTAVSRGLAAIHLNQGDGGIRPHLHTLIILERDVNFSDNHTSCAELRQCWQDACSGIEYADMQPVDRFEAALRYAIGGGLPQGHDDRLALEAILKGMHMVRRIGQFKALTK